MFFNIPMTTLAVEAENLSIQEMDTMQRELDSVLAEFNKMATEEKMAELLAKESTQYFLCQNRISGGKCERDCS